jgi:hypothetical protein
VRASLLDYGLEPWLSIAHSFFRGEIHASGVCVFFCLGPLSLSDSLPTSTHVI